MARSVMLTEAEHEHISAAIRQAEAGTAGEIYVVVGSPSDEYGFVPVLWAAVAAMLLAWLLHLLTPLSTTWVLALQAAAFVALAIGLSLLPPGGSLIPPALRTHAARRMARMLFLAHGIHLTEARTGVLLLVCPRDRRVELVADTGIHERVNGAIWDEVVAEVSQAAAAGHLGEGIARGVSIIGEALATHFPPSSQDRNELPDRVIEV
jgi:putative membrane protein